MQRKTVEYWYMVDERTKVKKKLQTIKKKTTFALVYLMHSNGKIIEVVRIDNYPHDGKAEPHIHRFKETKVEFRSLTLREAEETLLRIGEHIRRKYEL